MRVLILSCNTGGGHNSCAGAIQEAFAEQGEHCDITDSLGFVSDKLSRLVSWGHTAMYRHVPGLFRFGYGFAEKHPAMLQDEAAVYKLLTGGTEQLHSYLQQGQYDTVICTHVFSGLLLSQTIKEYGLSLQTAFIGTDYTCSPGTANSELDLYFIPAASLTEEFVAHGVPKEKIIPSGIPVRKAFYEHPNQADAKRKLGIDPTHTHLLLMCGSMGCGPMERLTELLSTSLENDMELTIVCGTNEKLYQDLTEKVGEKPNIRIYGFTSDMAGLMDSADLYLTKPGGLSTTEAAAKDLPMVFVDAVAGCEEYNLQYFVQLGGAVTAGGPEALCEMCLELMRDEKRRARMKAVLAALPRQNAAQCIRNALHSDKEAV